MNSVENQPFALVSLMPTTHKTNEQAKNTAKEAKKRLNERDRQQSQHPHRPRKAVFPFGFHTPLSYTSDVSVNSRKFLRPDAQYRQLGFVIV